MRQQRAKHLFVLAALAAVVFGAARPVAAADSVVVSSDSALQAAIANSVGGTIQLTPGTYAAVDIVGKSTSTPLVITSMNPSDQARVRGPITIEGSSNVVIRDLVIDPVGPHDFDQWDQAVHVRDSEQISLQRMVIDGHITKSGEGVSPGSIPPGDAPPDAIVGYPFGLGLAVRFSSDVVVEDVEVRDFAVGGILQNSIDVTISRAHVHDIRIDGIDLEDVRRVTIEDSRFDTFLPWLNSGAADSDHADMIQYWGVNSEWGIEDLTIRRNLFLQAGGEYTQTIFGALSGGDPDSVSFQDFEIADNIIMNSHVYGIAVGNLTNSEIHHNLLIPAAGYPGSSPNDGIPRVQLLQSDPPSTGNSVHSNVLVRAWWQDDATDYFGDSMAVNDIGANTYLDEAGESPSFLSVYPHAHDSYVELPDLRWSADADRLLTAGHGPRWIDEHGILRFVDIASSVFESDILWMSDLGITTGCTEVEFCPDDHVTRGQMAAFFTRAFALPSATPAGFSDVAESVFRNDIDRLAASGITAGCTDRLYCPDEFVTRGQMAAFFARALNLQQSPSAGFDDTNETIFAVDIDRFAAAGITQGCTDALFCPEDLVTRGQMAAFFHRASRHPAWPGN